jgi:hypothetical protein
MTVLNGSGNRNNYRFTKCTHQIILYIFSKLLKKIQYLKTVKLFFQYKMKTTN